jgi:hypothetical protein
MIRDTTDNNKASGVMDFGQFAGKLGKTAQGFLAKHHPDVLKYEKTV